MGNKILSGRRRPGQNTSYESSYPKHEIKPNLKAKAEAEETTAEMVDFIQKCKFFDQVLYIKHQ